MRSVIKPLSALLIVTIGLGVACSTAQPDRVPVPQEGCEVMSKGDAVIRVTTMREGDAVLRVTSTQNPVLKTTVNEYEMTIGGARAYAMKAQVAADGKVNVESRYLAPFVAKDVVMKFDVVDGALHGTIDGKPASPMDIEAAKTAGAAYRPTHADGTPVVFAIPADLDAQVARLMTKVDAYDANECKAVDESGAAPALNKKSEPGHLSDPGSRGDCKACEFACSVGFAVCTYFGLRTCITVCKPALAVPWVGPVIYAVCLLGCGAGVITVCGAGYLGCRNECNKRFCCPVACGTQCCNDGESCLDPAAGLCCSEHLKACPGPQKSCVDLNAERCMPNGSGCPIARSCGSHCCNILPPGGFGDETFCGSSVDINPRDGQAGICCRVTSVYCKKHSPVAGTEPGVCCQHGACIDGVCNLPEN